MIDTDRIGLQVDTDGRVQSLSCGDVKAPVVKGTLNDVIQYKAV